MKVLHAVHDYLPRHRAGVELYVQRLARALSPEHESGVLCTEYSPAGEHGQVVERRHEDLAVFEIAHAWTGASFEDSYRDPTICQSLRRVLSAERPDVLHVHNLLGLGLELPKLAQALGIPVVMTLHDHHLMCPSGGIRYHHAERHRCDELDLHRCARCYAGSPYREQQTLARLPQAGRRLLPVAARLQRRLPRLAAGARAVLRRGGGRIQPAQIEARLAAAREAAASVARFVSPSQHLALEHQRLLDLPPERIEVSAYGLPPLTPERTAETRELRLGFVGTLRPHKGLHRLLKALRLMKTDGLRLLVYGSLETDPGYVAALQRLGRGLPVEFRGGFGDADTPRVFGSFDVLLVPSLWPENAPFVIQEAFQAGLPVVAQSLGGIPELVADGRSGLLVPAGDPRALATAIGRLRDEPGLLERLRAGIPQVRSIEDDAAAWAVRYAEVTAR